MRSRFAIALGVIAAVLFSGGIAAGAAASAPVALDPGFVTDEAGVLTDDQIADANARLTELADADRGDLYVVFVDEFVNPSDAVDWANATAEDNGLGADQYLLAVAVESRQYALSVDQDAPLSDSDLASIEDAVQERLRASDWNGAIGAAAEAFPGPSMIGWFLLGLVVLAGIVVLVVVLVRRARARRRGAQPAVPDPNDPYSSISDDDLATQAGSALVAADDAITSSREELGFAIAQFGDDSTAPFTQVVDSAAATVAEAFALKQRIDDEVADTAAERRAWHIQILQLCAQADDLLDDNIEAFEELRRLEADAPNALATLQTRRQGLQQTVAAAEQSLAALARTYDATALSTVADNPTQIRERLALADAEIADAAALIQAAKTGEAAYAIRTAEQAVIQAEQLVAAVESLASGLGQLEQQARAVIADLESDIAVAEGLPDTRGLVAPVVAGVRARIADAQRGLAAAPRNPQALLDALSAADTEIDAAVAQARDAVEQTQRVQRVMQQRLLQAQSEISSANSYVATRRGAISATARTRLAEANAAYEEAVAAQATDPQRAIERATRAYNLAREAVSTAEGEVSAWTGGFGGSYGVDYDRGDDLAGDILGGILGGLFSGGGGGGGGGSYSGGGGWRSSGGSSSRGYRPSSFGGSSRRSSSRSSSRSSGSRGGRSRGGRF